MSLGIYDKSGPLYRLPHPPLSLRTHLVVEKAIRAAWQMLLSRKRDGFNPQTASEDQITLQLHERLFDEVFDRNIVDGFDRQIFGAIRREPKVRNFNGVHPDKMPDLLMDFVDRPAGAMNSQHGLFIECKPVDRLHGVGPRYCDDGLIRFVRGDYGWAMQSAMMVGYARKDFPIFPRLSEAMKAKRKEPIRVCGRLRKCPESSATAQAEQVAVSHHERVFSYTNSSDCPGQIMIRHLWLRL